MKKIADKDFVSAELIQTYEEIDGLEVIKEYLLYKGEDYAVPSGGKRYVRFSELLKFAFVHYKLKVTATNKLYLPIYLEKSLKRLFLMEILGSVEVPSNIYDEVKETNDKYRSDVSVKIEMNIAKDYDMVIRNE